MGVQPYEPLSPTHRRDEQTAVPGWRARQVECLLMGVSGTAGMRRKADIFKGLGAASDHEPKSGRKQHGNHKSNPEVGA